LWNAEKEVLGWKLIALKAYIRKEEKSQINNPSFYLKKMKTKSKINPNNSKKK
jgi:hypothetical protein